MTGVDQIQSILSCIAVSDLFLALAMMFCFLADDKYVCYSQGLLIQLGGIAEFCWTCFMAIELYLIVVVRSFTLHAFIHCRFVFDSNTLATCSVGCACTMCWAGLCCCSCLYL